MLPLVRTTTSSQAPRRWSNPSNVSYTLHDNGTGDVAVSSSEVRTWSSSLILMRMLLTAAGSNGSQAPDEHCTTIPVHNDNSQSDHGGSLGAVAAQIRSRDYRCRVRSASCLRRSPTSAVSLLSRLPWASY